jgi:hypothetical protein
MTTRIVMLLATGTLFVPLAYGQQPVAAPAAVRAAPVAARAVPAAVPAAAPSDPAKAPKDPDPPVAKQDPTWKRLNQLIGRPVAGDDHPEARAQLEKTLGPENQGGVKVLPIRCNAKVGCIADVVYADAAAFTRFDEGKFGPGTTIDKWNGINGRTGLLREGNRLIATWYFFIRRPSKQKRGA